ncbi:MAG: hypothetical protein AAF708_16885 [Deinococcota bacterium]
MSRKLEATPKRTPQTTLDALLVAGHDHAQTLLSHLHETPLQNIYAALTQLHLLENRLKYVSILPAGTFNALTQATSLLETCLDDLQKTYTSLHHPNLVDTPIAQLLREMCIEHELLSGQVINLTTRDLSLPACYKICLFYVCEMVLAQLRQEVNSSGIELTLAADETAVVLEFRDTESRLSRVLSEDLHAQLNAYVNALLGTWQQIFSETLQVLELTLPLQSNLATLDSSNSDSSNSDSSNSDSSNSDSSNIDDASRT